MQRQIWSGQLATQMTSYLQSDAKPTIMAEEYLHAEIDEPPDDQDYHGLEGSSHCSSRFSKSHPAQNNRKHSLLTQALVLAHSGDEYEGPTHGAQESSNMRRGLSSISTPSNASAASTADLTSDGFTSPTRTSSPSPPLPPTTNEPSVIFRPIVDFHADPLVAGDAESPAPLGLQVQDAGAKKSAESAVEAGLGRKRCITFACGKNKPSEPEASDDGRTTTTKTEEPAPQDPKVIGKRPCALRFICPGTSANDAKRKESQSAATEGRTSSTKQPEKSDQSTPSRRHRDSESTLEAGSVRKGEEKHLASHRTHRASHHNNEGDLTSSEATRFHEFASSMDEDDEWMDKPTDASRRITVSDTLVKENAIRKLGEEAEAEAEEEEEQEEEEGEEGEEGEGLDVEEDEGDDDEDVENGSKIPSDKFVHTLRGFEDDDDASSLDGNETDDEEGFAQSDDESEAGSDLLFWTLGTGVDPAPSQTDNIRPRDQCAASLSSIDSLPNARISSFSKMNAPIIKRQPRDVRKRSPRTASPSLPDSTDFVCGTFDEDRPLEAAYASCLEERRKSKHNILPQDIDPSFPTSDPEQDDDDDEGDENDAKEPKVGSPKKAHVSGVTHSPLQDTESTPSTRRGREQATKKKSPIASPRRMQSPPPLKNVHRSPPPANGRPGLRSPRRLHSPPPPRRARSPAPFRVTSPELSPKQFVPLAMAQDVHGPPVMHTKSLPRAPNVSRPKGRYGYFATNQSRDFSHHRGAIDIYKGLEKKRQRRKEKLWHKQCQQRAAKEKERKPRPGKGAERMRELGLEMAGRGKGTVPGHTHAQYVLSI